MGKWAVQPKPQNVIDVQINESPYRVSSRAEHLSNQQLVRLLSSPQQPIRVGFIRENDVDTVRSGIDKKKREYGLFI